MPRNFATFGPSKLQPPFTGVSVKSKLLYSLILQHWAGVSLYTSFYKLAETCVFIKQSLSPILCQLLKKLLLIPKLQSHFAEFLQYNYLNHLNFLNLFTCVGFSTVHYKLIYKLFLESNKNFLLNTIK